MSPQRKRVVILCALATIMSGAGNLLHNHPIGRIVWLLLIVLVFSAAMFQFVKLKKEEG